MIELTKENFPHVSERVLVRVEDPIVFDTGVPPADEVSAVPLPVDARDQSSELQQISEGKAKYDLPGNDGPNFFNRPRILELRCLQDIRTAQGRTLVKLRWWGWGFVRAQAELGGQVFQTRLKYGWPGQREIDLLVPVGAMLTVSVRNAWGFDYDSLQVSTSEPAMTMLVPPSLPSINGVRIPAAKLPPFPSTAFSRLIPELPRFPISIRQSLPAIEDRLTHTILLESRRLNGLSAWFGNGQRDRGERRSSIYASLRVADMNIVPVRDKLKAWMVEIHQGDDETEPG
jgi:hypothetical protein